VKLDGSIGGGTGVKQAEEIHGLSDYDSRMNARRLSRSDDSDFRDMNSLSEGSTTSTI